MFEAIYRFNKLLGIETFLRHFFDGYKPVTELGICGLIDGTKASLTYLVDDPVAVIEQALRGQKPAERT